MSCRCVGTDAFIFVFVFEYVYVCVLCTCIESNCESNIRDEHTQSELHKAITDLRMQMMIAVLEMSEPADLQFSQMTAFGVCLVFNGFDLVNR